MPKSLPGAASSLSPPTLRIRAPEGLAGAIDPETHAAVSARLAIQEQDAIRDLYLHALGMLPGEPESDS